MGQGKKGGGANGTPSSTPIFGYVTGGAANTLVMASPSSPVTSYINGGKYIFISNVDIPGGITTLNISGVGAKDVETHFTVSPSNRDLLADLVYELVWITADDVFYLSAFVSSEIATALEGAIVSGILTGGEVTINVDTTKFDVAAGTGVIFNWTIPGSPKKTPVTWLAKTAVLPPDASAVFTVNGIDVNGDLVHGGALFNESGVPFTDAQQRGIITLQTAATTDGVNVTEIGGSSRPAYEVLACVIDWVQTHSPLTTGNIFSDDTATTISKAAGTTSGLFVNRNVDPQSPTTKTNVQIATVNAGATYQDGIGGFTNEVPSTTIVLDKIDDGSGTLATMTNNKYAIRRIIFFGVTEFSALTYGQAEYNSLIEAKAAIFTEDPTIDPILSVGAFTTALIHKKGADLTNAAEAEFVVIQSESIGGGASTIIPPDSVTNTELANMAANTVKGNDTGSSGDPVDIAMAASTMLARLAAGNIVDATPAEIITLLDIFKNGGDTTGAARTIGNVDNFALDVLTNNVKRISVLETGEVGINKAAPSAQLQVGGDVKIDGNLIVDGESISVNVESVNVEDNHLYLNAGYTVAVAQTGGLAVNNGSTGTTDTVSAGAFVAGVPATSNPTVVTVGAATFSASDLIQISGTNNNENDGLFEVLTHAANVLTIRGIGTTAKVEDFTDNQFVANASDSAAITKVTVSVIRAGIDGVWETASGSVTGFTFTDADGNVTTSATLTDNSLVRGNGTSDVDVCNVTVSADGDNLTIPEDLTASGQITFDLGLSLHNVKIDGNFFNAASGKLLLNDIGLFTANADHCSVVYFKGGISTAMLTGVHHNGLYLEFAGNGSDHADSIPSGLFLTCGVASGATVFAAIRIDSDKWSHGIYQVDASVLNYFRGNVGINKVTPVEALDIVGNIAATGVITGETVEATGDTAAGDDAAMGHTVTEGLILTGQGSTNDVTIKNDADADVIKIPTGTTNVVIVGDITAAAHKAPSGVVVASEYENFWIDAAAMVPRITNGAEPLTKEFATNDIMIDSYAFDSLIEEGVQFKLNMPDDWDLGTIKVKLYWDVSGATTGTVIWGVRAGALSNDDAIDQALGTEVTITDTFIAVGDNHITPASAVITVGGTPALEDMTIFQIVAKTSSIDVDILLMGISIQYKKKITVVTLW